MLPNLIIPGSQKSGTSSLYKYIKNHPECLMSEPKEPAFFSQKSNLQDIEKYKKCFKLKSNKRDYPKVVGEATTSYMVEEYVPTRINEILGDDINFIFILRNPIERAFSAYWHLYKRKHERRNVSQIFDFKNYDPIHVVKEEESRIKNAIKRNNIIVEPYKGKYEDFLWPFRYIRNSLYIKDILRFTKYFHKKNMFFVIFEELINNPKIVLSDIESFLGIKEFYPSDLGKVYNRTKIYRSKYALIFSDFLKKFDIINSIKNEISYCNKVYKKILLREKPDIKKKRKLKLKEVFFKSNVELSNFLGKNLFDIWD